MKDHSPPLILIQRESILLLDKKFTFFGGGGGGSNRTGDTRFNNSIFVEQTTQPKDNIFSIQSKHGPSSDLETCAETRNFVSMCQCGHQFAPSPPSPTKKNWGGRMTSSPCSSMCFLSSVVQYRGLSSVEAVSLSSVSVNGI